MTDRGRERLRLRPGSYGGRATEARPASMLPVPAGEMQPRRRFSWGEHPLAEVVFSVIGSLAVASWLVAAMLIFLLAADRNGPEGMTGLGVALGMPPVLVVAFGFTAVAASVWHRYWGGRVSLVISIWAALGAVLAPCTWMAVVGLPFSAWW